MMKMARKGFDIYNSCHGHNWHNGHNGFNNSYCPKTPSNAYSDDHNECDGLIIYDCCNISYIMNIRPTIFIFLPKFRTPE